MPKVNDDEGSTENKRPRKRRLIALGMVGVLALGGAAFAYFTTTGSGTGDTQAGTSTALTINGTITPSAGGIVPGGLADPVTFTVTNTGEGSQRVGTIHLESVGAFTSNTYATAIPGCDTSAFSVADVVANQTVPGLATTAITASGNLVFANLDSNQDACKLAYIRLTFSSN